MSRISNSTASLYTSIGEPGTCYFCGATHLTATFKEYTPQVRCGPIAIESFIEEPTISTACGPCSAKIYRANASFSMGRGLMTLDDKRHVVGASIAAQVHRMARFVLDDGTPVIIPAAMHYDPATESFYLNSLKYSADEIRAVQAVLYLIRAQAATWVIDLQWEYVRLTIEPSAVARLQEMVK